MLSYPISTGNSLYIRGSTSFFPRYFPLPETKAWSFQRRKRNSKKKNKGEKEKIYIYLFINCLACPPSVLSRNGSEKLVQLDVTTFVAGRIMLRPTTQTLIYPSSEVSGDLMGGPHNNMASQQPKRARSASKTSQGSPTSPQPRPSHPSHVNPAPYNKKGYTEGGEGSKTPTVEEENDSSSASSQIYQYSPRSEEGRNEVRGFEGFLFPGH